jgi:hypothetical protein
MKVKSLLYQAPLHLRGGRGGVLHTNENHEEKHCPLEDTLQLPLVSLPSTTGTPLNLLHQANARPKCTLQCRIPVAPNDSTTIASEELDEAVAYWPSDLIKQQSRQTLCSQALCFGGEASEQHSLQRLVVEMEQ